MHTLEFEQIANFPPKCSNPIPANPRRSLSDAERHHEFVEFCCAIPSRRRWVRSWGYLSRPEVHSVAIQLGGRQQSHHANRGKQGE
jgi:hypothetical protein